MNVAENIKKHSKFSRFSKDIFSKTYKWKRNWECSTPTRLYGRKI